MESGPSRELPSTSTAYPFALAIILSIGAVAVVLAGMPTGLFDLERHLFPKELALHVTALAAVLLLVPRWRSVRPGVVELLAAMAVAWTWFSAVFATNRWLAFHAAAIPFSMSVVYLAARRVRGTGAAPALVFGLAAATTLAAATGLAQAWGVESAWFVQDRAPGGTFGNRNFLAHFVVVGAAPLLAVALGGWRTRGQWSGAAVLAVAVTIVVLTRSRASWLAFLAASGAVVTGLFLAGAARRRELPRGNVRRIAGAVLLGVAAATLLPNRLEWRADAPYAATARNLLNYREGSGQGRVIQYTNSLKLVAEDPVLGTGPGNWYVHYPRVTSPGDPAYAGWDPVPTNPWPSSDWIAWLVELGPAGTLLLVLMGSAAAVVCLRRLRGGSAEEVTGALATLALLAAAGTVALFDAVMHLAAPAFVTAAWLGLVLPETRPVVDRPLGGRRGRAARWAVVVLSGVIALSAMGRVAALAVAGHGRERDALERAVRWDPGSHRLHLRLAARGPCAARRPHIEALERLTPHHPITRELRRRCGTRTGRRTDG